MFLMLFAFFNFAHAQSQYDNQVNDHILESSKKMEIEQKKTQVELEKSSPDYLEYNPPHAPQTQPFVVEPPKQKQDAGIYQEDQQFTPSTENDPSAQIEQDVEAQRELANEQKKNRQQFIKEFEENAAKAGVKVNIDPNTLQAQPEK